MQFLCWLFLIPGRFGRASSDGFPAPDWEPVKNENDQESSFVADVPNGEFHLNAIA